MSNKSRDVIFSGNKNPAVRSTTSSRACNQAQTIPSYENIHLLPLTASHQEYLTFTLPLPASPYYKYHCPHASSPSPPVPHTHVMMWSVGGVGYWGECDVRILFVICKLLDRASMVWPFLFAEHKGCFATMRENNP